MIQNMEKAIDAFKPRHLILIESDTDQSYGLRERLGHWEDVNPIEEIPASDMNYSLLHELIQHIAGMFPLTL